MVVLVVISMAHAAGVGVGTMTETPELVRRALSKAISSGLPCSVACRIPTVR